MPDPKLIRIATDVPIDAIPVFEAALEPFVLSMVWSVDDERDLQTIEGYTDCTPDPALLDSALQGAAKAAQVVLGPVVVEELEDRDWVAENLSEFPPIKLGRFFIYGNHVTDRPLPGTVQLRVDQSVAFGTGQHATTAGCLTALEGLIKKRKFKRPLDMGTGSGILALAVQRLLRVPVSATDIDRRATGVAEINAQLNGAGAALRIATGAGYRALHQLRHRYGQGAAKKFDLIIANILARPLAGMAKDLAHNLEPGGVAVLSGLIERDERLVLGPHLRHGLKLQQRIVLDGWLTLVLKK